MARQLRALTTLSFSYLNTHCGSQPPINLAPRHLLTPSSAVQEHLEHVWYTYICTGKILIHINKAKSSKDQGWVRSRWSHSNSGHWVAGQPHTVCICVCVCECARTCAWVRPLLWCLSMAENRATLVGIFPLAPFTCLFEMICQQPETCQVGQAVLLLSRRILPPPRQYWNYKHVPAFSQGPKKQGEHFTDFSAILFLF